MTLTSTDLSLIVYFICYTVKQDFEIFSRLIVLFRDSKVLVCKCYNITLTILLSPID